MDALTDQAFRAMGTSCRIAVAGAADPRDADAAIAAGRAEIARCERVLSRFDAASDLTRVNAAAGNWVAVDPILLDALAAALRAREDTDGLYDPTVLPALTAAGYDRSFEQLALRDARPPLRPDGWRAGAHVELDAGRSRVRLPAGCAVDLGGIGKGYSATRAVRAMREAGPCLPGALADLGGDIAVGGAAPGGGGWRIGIADPREGGAQLGVLAVRGAGVATSGRDRRRFGPGSLLHHLIDPATGRPAGPGPLTVTVVAPTASVAEAHATALAILPVDRAGAYLGERPWLAALLVRHDGELALFGDLPLERMLTVGAEVAA
jgi:FAD:protein FMN transferase